MCKFYVVNGRVAEVHRFINVPRSSWEEHPARERRELWIATPTGREIKLVVHSRQMPARNGHQVDALLLEGDLVGLYNVTTGGHVNFLQADPPVLFRRIDAAAIAMLLVACFAAFVAGSVAILLSGLLTALLLSPPVLLMRFVRRANTRSKVDAALGMVARSHIERTVDRSLLRRVK